MDETDNIKGIPPPGSRFQQYAQAAHHHQMGGGPSNASHTGVGSCGDKLRLELCIEHYVIKEVWCYPKGCAYTAACAGAVSALARERTLEEALRILPEDVADELEGLPDDYLHCARLAVNTLGEAMAEYYRRQISAGKAGWRHP